MPPRKRNLASRSPADKVLLLVLILALGWLFLPWPWPTPASALREDPEVVDDAIILLDTTESMLGAGPDGRARDIWGQVQEAVLDIVDRVALGTNLAIVPFDAGPQWRRIYPGPIRSGDPLAPRRLETEADREDFKRHLRELPVDGQATWIYEPVDYALGQLQAWREADSGRTHRQALFLYTDGIDNGPHARQGIEGLAQLFRSRRADSRDLYVVYNDLGSVLTPEQRAQLERSQVVVTTGPPRSNLEIRTPTLDFGDLSLTPDGATRELVFSSRFADVWGKPVNLRLDFVGARLPLVLSPQGAAISEQIRVTLRPTGTLPSGKLQARLIIEPLDSAFNLIPRNFVDLSLSSLAASTATAEARATSAAAVQAMARARGTATAEARAAATARIDAEARAYATAEALTRARFAATAQAAASATAEAILQDEATAAALALATPTPTPEPPVSTVTGPLLPPEVTAALVRSLPYLGAAIGLVGLAGLVLLRVRRRGPFVEESPRKCDLLWARGHAPAAASDLEVEHRTLQPDHRLRPQSWTIGTAGDIVLPEDDSSLKRIHARIAYGGRQQPEFRLASAGGEVRVRSVNVDTGGIILQPDTVFVIGPYYFRAVMSARKRRRDHAPLRLQSDSRSSGR